MAVFSTFTVIRAVSFMHLVVAYFLLTNPRSVADQNLVVILGESMEIPHATTIIKPTETTAFASLLLLLLSTSDLLASSLPTRSALEYFSAIVPVRLLIFFALTIWIYFTCDDGTSTAEAVLRSVRAAGGLRGGLDLLKNSLVFSLGFVESVTWFWIYTLLTDERRAFVMQEFVEESKREEERKERAMYGL